MKMGMSQQGVDNVFASRTEDTCSFVLASCALGFVAQFMGGGVDVAATTGFDGVLGTQICHYSSVER